MAMELEPRIVHPQRVTDRRGRKALAESRREVQSRRDSPCQFTRVDGFAPVGQEQGRKPPDVHVSNGCLHGQEGGVERGEALHQ
jgi:hypothetical protein